MASAEYSCKCPIVKFPTNERDFFEAEPDGDDEDEDEDEDDEDEDEDDDEDEDEDEDDEDEDDEETCIGSASDLALTIVQPNLSLPIWTLRSWSSD